MVKDKLTKMRFVKKVFRKGLNVSVRLGDEWSGFTGVVEVQDGTQLRVLDTIYFERFGDIREDERLLQFAHDPDARNVHRLFQLMRQQYPARYGRGEDDRAEFTKETSVTMVLFTVRKFAKKRKI